MLYLEYMNINVRLIGQAPEGKNVVPDSSAEGYQKKLNMQY